MKRCIPLEPAAEAVCNQSSVPPLIFQLPHVQGRRVLEEAQDTPVYKYPADISSDCINTGMWGSIPVYFILPRCEKIRNVIFYNSRRSEGEAFGEKLRCAGVEVTALRVQGIIHDFVMLNALDQTNACRTAMDASTQWMNRFN